MRFQKCQNFLILATKIANLQGEIGDLEVDVKHSPSGLEGGEGRGRFNIGGGGAIGAGGAMGAGGAGGQ